MQYMMWEKRSISWDRDLKSSVKSQVDSEKQYSIKSQ
jgi:hypothetical protein